MAARKDLTSGRARRAMKIGGLASQVGSSYLWTSLRRPFLSTGRYDQELLDTHLKNARRIVEGSQQLRGAFMKLIQMLSTRADLLPGEALDILKATQSSVPPMDYALIAKQIRREFSKSPEQLFASFEHEAFAAASLGQVHRARLKSGEEVAVKIQYPGVDTTVEQDLGNLKLLLRTLQAIAGDIMRQKIDTKTIFTELAERLREEIDYVSEARNIAEFNRLLAGDDDIVLPRVIKELSTRRVLTMTYVDGYRLADVFGTETDAKLRAWVARKYYCLLWRQILEFGVLHTDPQPGNYLVSYHPKLGILDFGSVRHFSEPVRKASLQLAQAIIAGDDRTMAAALVKLGYLDRMQEPAPMVRIIYLLFEPVITDRPYHPDEFDAIGKAATVGEIAYEHKLYKSPRHSIFLVRSLIGLDGIMKGLGAKMNYAALFRECVRAGSQGAENQLSRAESLANRKSKPPRKAAPAGAGAASRDSTKKLAPAIALRGDAADSATMAELLEAHRDHTFRRVPSRRVNGEQGALAFINQTGFCAAFTAGLGVPCLREAIEGRREPKLPEHIQHDRAIMMTWNLKDTLPARKAVYYGKVIAGRPSFIALELLPAFLRLRVTPGGHRKLYERGALSHCAKLVMDALTLRGAAETKALKLSSGYAQPNRRADFDRAMKELQEKFLALKVEERYDPFTYVWDTVENRWGEALRAARALSPGEAAYRIVRRYFEIAAYGNDRVIARILGIDPALVDRALRRLEREGEIRRGLRVASIRETISILASFV